MSTGDPQATWMMVIASSTLTQSLDMSVTILPTLSVCSEVLLSSSDLR